MKNELRLRCVKCGLWNRYGNTCFTEGYWLPVNSSINIKACDRQTGSFGILLKEVMMRLTTAEERNLLINAK